MFPSQSSKRLPSITVIGKGIKADPTRFLAVMIGVATIVAPTALVLTASPEAKLFMLQWQAHHHRWPINAYVDPDEFHDNVTPEFREAAIATVAANADVDAQDAERLLARTELSARGCFVDGGKGMDCAVSENGVTFDFVNRTHAAYLRDKSPFGSDDPETGTLVGRDVGGKFVEGDAYSMVVNPGNSPGMR